MTYFCPNCQLSPLPGRATRTLGGLPECPDCGQILVSTTIRYSPDASICMVDEDGEFRAPTQADMDTLPVGPDLDQSDLDSLEVAS